MLPQDWLDELISKNEIVDVVSKYVDLKPKGKRYWGCCPFHGEKTASFNVDSVKQFFYCFGCSKGGSVIQFIMNIENMSYIEAVEYLAQKSSMTMPGRLDSKKEEEKQNRRKLHNKMYKEAALFYFNNLKNDKGQAVAYCKSRGLSSQIIVRFGIGYALNEYDSLYKYLQGKGFKKQDMEDGGLIRVKDTKVYDFFRNRLIFPIIDIYGNVIAFGGRVFDSSLPKYLNSGDSIFYNKKKHLYGLNIVKKEKTIEYVILTEGYMDVIGISSYGIKGAIASLGTSLTKEQVSLIKRFTTNVYIAYDGDNAGVKATLRACDLLVEGGIMPKIIVMKDGLDPDEYLKKYGEDGFYEQLSKAVLPHKFRIDVLAKGYDFSDEIQRREFSLKAIEIVSSLKNNLDKEDMIKYIQLKTGYSYETLKSQDEKTVPSNKEQPITKPIVKNKRTLQQKGEMLLIKLMANGYSVYADREDVLNLFVDEGNKDIVMAVKGGAKDEQSLVNHYGNSEILTKVMDIINLNYAVNDKSLKDTLLLLRINFKKRKIKELENRLKEEIAKEERNEILREIVVLQKEVIGKSKGGVK